MEKKGKESEAELREQARLLKISAQSAGNGGYGLTNVVEQVVLIIADKKLKEADEIANQTKVNF